MNNKLNTLMKAYLISGDSNAFYGLSMIDKHSKEIKRISESDVMRGSWIEVGKSLDNAIEKYNKKELHYHAR